MFTFLLHLLVIVVVTHNIKCCLQRIVRNSYRSGTLYVYARVCVGR